MGDTYPKFKAAAAQVSPVFLNRKATVEKACRVMMEAAKKGAKLIAFPETYIPGYPHWIWLDAPTANNHFFRKLFDESVTIPSPTTEELCVGAKEADIYVVIGINEKLPNQMGTMWNTNLIIDNKGKILGKHRKIVPTFAEKMVWSCGDGSMLRVWETDLGRLGTLACGNNTHSLYRYALIAQGEQIHVANYPAFLQESDIDLPLWNRIRTGSHSLEGKLFNLCSTSTVTPEIIDMVCGSDEKKKNLMENHRSYSCITNPIGITLGELLDEEGIIYADIDISEMITAKQFHDIVGHYTRMDVVSMNLCTDEDKPLWYEKRAEGHKNESDIDFNLLKDVFHDQKQILEELRRLVTLINKKLGDDK